MELCISCHTVEGGAITSNQGAIAAVTKANPLGSEKVGKLILKFSIPAVVSLVVNALYNILDQIFIGQAVGILGIAATNVAFPLSTICVSVNVLLGIGSASNFNLKQGAGDKEDASYIAGHSMSLAVILGLGLTAIAQIFLTPMLTMFGATETVMPLAQTYTRITSLGIPFLVITMVCMHMIRADGNPTYSMFVILSGAVFKVIFTPIFLFVFGLGMAGVAWTTTLGQILSGTIGLVYMVKRFKSVPLKREHLRLQAKYVKMIFSLGIAAFFNQIAMTLVQITMNNTLRIYGAESAYGSDIPLACVGAITKVIILYMAFTVGVSQGCQPILGFNYGAKNYQRVKDTLKLAVIAASVISVIFFCLFQFIPQHIMGLFGSGDPLYLELGAAFLRTYTFMTFINGIQPVCANFLTSIGKAKLGILVSMTRQIIFLLPLILILPMFFGVTGVMFAGPIADSAAFIVSITLVISQLRLMTKLQKQASPLLEGMPAVP
ncbi:MAG: MATE family efflux transporter [Ruminococcaceae bacterium]|nr:MATE family efflux transporter [Oscillospiraceae bacterium]